MKKIVRKTTFETNSSSTHALIFCNEEQYNKLKSEELWLSDRYGDADIITKEEADNIIEELLKELTEEENVSVEELKKEINEDYDGDVRAYFIENESYDEFPCPLGDWMEDYEHDVYSIEHKGEKLYALCAHGYNY